jgi:UDP-3-O-[3-hydroxymyristoyl] glucosamine N-acyltransferase
MDELHDGDILKELLAKKDKLIAKLENIVESQHQHVAMLQNDLYNEQLRNSNLSELALAIDKQKESKPEDN